MSWAASSARSSVGTGTESTATNTNSPPGGAARARRVSSGSLRSASSRPARSVISACPALWTVKETRSAVSRSSTTPFTQLP